jgi:hypothetical protein
MKDILNCKPCDLHPELQARMFDGPMGKRISHPFVQEIFYAPEMNALYNKQFEAKSHAATVALAAKDYAKFIVFHEKPYRLDAFSIVQSDMSDAMYWDTLSDLWIESENIWQNLRAWKGYLRSERSHREQFMSAEDRRVFASLPVVLDIYRGHQGRNTKGISYTLSKEKAEWFANRFKSSKAAGQVKHRRVAKRDCFAYLGGRGEQEIIIL